MPPVGLGPRTLVPWAQENVAYFVQSLERRSYIGACPPQRHRTVGPTLQEATRGGGVSVKVVADLGPMEVDPRYPRPQVVASGEFRW